MDYVFAIKKQYTPQSIDNNIIASIMAKSPSTASLTLKKQNWIKPKGDKKKTRPRVRCDIYVFFQASRRYPIIFYYRKWRRNIWRAPFLPHRIPRKPANGANSKKNMIEMIKSRPPTVRSVALFCIRVPNRFAESPLFRTSLGFAVLVAFDVCRITQIFIEIYIFVNKISLKTTSFCFLKDLYKKIWNAFFKNF